MLFFSLRVSVCVLLGLRLFLVLYLNGQRVTCMPALVATKLITNTCYTLTSTALKDTLRTFSLTHSQNKKIVSVKQENGSIS